MHAIQIVTERMTLHGNFITGETIRINGGQVML